MDMEIEKQKINIITTNGKLTVSSMMVAEHFEKDHKDVLRKIRQTISELPENTDHFNERNFAPVEYIDNKGEMRPAYDLTRDGFVLLVMGSPARRRWPGRLSILRHSTPWKGLKRTNYI